MPTKPDWAALGPLTFTPTISGWIENRSDILISISQKLDLFRDGDWGDLCEDDWRQNIDTIKSTHPGGTLIGAYKLFDGRRIWIMTSGYATNYSYTTAMSPEDY